jgi:enamine deaminase RidA (YjgF/YER057c/UK114 family)
LEVEKMSLPELTLINPAGLANPTDKGFSHLAVIPPGAKTVYISSQFGADVAGRIVSDDYAVRLRQSFRNLRIAIEEAGAVPQSAAKLTILIVNHSDDKLPPLREELGPRPVAPLPSSQSRECIDVDAFQELMPAGS